MLPTTWTPLRQPCVFAVETSPASSSACARNLSGSSAPYTRRRGQWILFATLKAEESSYAASGPPGGLHSCGSAGLGFLRGACYGRGQRAPRRDFSALGPPGRADDDALTWEARRFVSLTLSSDCGRMNL